MALHADYSNSDVIVHVGDNSQSLPHQVSAQYCVCKITIFCSQKGKNISAFPPFINKIIIISQNDLRTLNSDGTET